MLVHVLTLKIDDGKSLQLVSILMTHHAVPSVHGRVVLQDKNKTRRGRVFDENTHVDIS